MSTITVYIPDKAQLDQKDTIKSLAAKLYEAGKLTLGPVAEMAGFSKVAFAGIIVEHGVSLINYPMSDSKSDTAKI